MKTLTALIMVLMLAASSSRPARKVNKSPTSPILFAYETRADGASRITDSPGSSSSQNPVFSPDSCYILLTHFQNGYNRGPSELVRIRIDGAEPAVIIPADDADNVCAPYGSWINGKITWASDRAGGAEEIFLAAADGSDLRQATSHPASQGYYIEPVFDPADPDKIAFEFGASDADPHHIRLLELDQGGRITALTDDPSWDDRLPSWSPDGTRICFQRNAVAGPENWEIMVGTISLSPVPALNGLTSVSRASSQETDNSWSWTGRYILSSSDCGGLPVPNIFAFPSSGAGSPVRVTYSSDCEDGAPAFSPNGKWIAFESHQGEDSPSEIWIIAAPPLPAFPEGRGDYDGDGTSDCAVFRPAPGLWAVRNLTRLYFGTMGDSPVPEDYDGDGTAEFGVHRHASGLWAVRGLTRIIFGAIFDQPVPGDFNGDGTSSPAIFRRGNGLWAVREFTRFYFGFSRDLAVTGDYDGDGSNDPAVFRPSAGFWAVRGLSRFYFGTAGDEEAGGDFSGDGTWEAASFNPPGGLWAVRGMTRFYFGERTDWPVLGDYDGDGAADPGVFRDNGGLWSVRGLTRVHLGGIGAAPVGR